MLVTGSGLFRIEILGIGNAPGWFSSAVNATLLTAVDWLSFQILTVYVAVSPG